MSSKIHWLASYPKSGNTWLRLVLSHLMREPAQETSLNDIAGGTIATDRMWIDRALGFPTSELLPDEILDLRPAVYRWTADKAERAQFHKIHDACLSAGGGGWLPSVEASGPGVYLVRNPLDVAVSFASHLGRTIDKTITAMEPPGMEMGRSPQGGITVHLPHVLPGWSDHVVSWIDNPHFDMLLVRYEDMLAQPAEWFGRIARHLMLDAAESDVAQAIEQTRFERLQEQEAQEPFKEKPLAAERFFRKGIAGDWQQSLSPAQVERIVATHRPMMERLGYCDGNGKPQVM
ncbi:sulfotransferase domain-containing protein [Erythrobacter sp. SDW2]|uniref:sulfotransferase domain-containing protein n=1 Tax=Erythrobacter sp. SDW2 TaxID=2907154 RepID=UPI001F1701D5|nr:sulfotransferase domain-containing protein [Erythrobacter sp. SDW2]UIP06153.1 sulfotransferase domain-containing protein [Erythrobacter sp. SDW2]